MKSYELMCTLLCIASGKVYTWGLGSTGQLGHGDNKNKQVYD